MLGRVQPLAGLVARLLPDDIHPAVLDLRPSPVDVMAALVLDGHKTVGLHVAGEDLVPGLRYARFEDEDARGIAHSEEQVLRQLDYLLQAVLREYAFG